MFPRPEFERRLNIARSAALDAGRLILNYYQSAALTLDRKRDSSPVTIADTLGEEFGERSGTSGYRWILDPLDGTKSFICGVPLFGTLIGVEFENQCVLGVCHFPALGETAWGAKGLGAWWQPAGGEPRPARVSNVASLSESLF